MVNSCSFLMSLDLEVYCSFCERSNTNKLLKLDITTKNENVIESLYDNVIKTYSTCSDAHTFGQKIVLAKESAGIIL